MAEVVKSGVIFRILAAISPVTWNRISFWTKASDVEFDDNDTSAGSTTLQGRIGSVSGITSDASSTSDTVAASAALVNGFNANTAITLSSAAWSVGTTTINGTEYYTQVIYVTKVWDVAPVCMLAAYDSGQILPSQEESNSFNNLAYVVGDTTANTVTFYATSAPTRNLKITVKGVTN